MSADSDGRGQSPSIVHVTTVGESLSFVRGHAEFMQHRGLRTIVVSSPDEHFDRFVREERVEGHSVAMSRRITPVRDLVSLLRLVRLFRQLNPTVVHAHTPKAGLLGTLAGLLAGVPVRVYQVHGLPLMTAHGARRAALWWSDKIACAAASGVLCVSRSIASVAVSEGVCAEQRMVVLGQGSSNGVDSLGRFNPARIGSDVRADIRRRFGIPATAVVVGFVGRVAKDKGVEDLVQAWGSLRGVCGSAHLMVVGDPEPHDPVGPATSGVVFGGLDGRVHWTGYQRDTPSFYAAMDVVALPSHREGLPIVPLEAAAMGLPVVATRIPGCVDAVLDGVTGRLVGPGDVVGLTDALRDYVEHPDLRVAHGDAGRRRVMECFKPGDLLEACAGYYRSLGVNLRDEVGS